MKLPTWAFDSAGFISKTETAIDRLSGWHRQGKIRPGFGGLARTYKYLGNKIAASLSLLFVSCSL